MTDAERDQLRDISREIDRQTADLVEITARVKDLVRRVDEHNAVCPLRMG